MVVYADREPVDLSAPSDSPGRDGRELLRELYPRTRFVDAGDRPLLQAMWRDDDDTLGVGVFANGAVVATRRAYLFNPSRLESRFLKRAGGGTVWLLAMRAVYDMFAYAVWRDGTLTRSLSANPVGKVWESIGDPLPFERPFWDGERVVADSPGYPLLFHPLEMGEAAIRQVLGTFFESVPATGLVDPETVRLRSFRRQRR